MSTTNKTDRLVEALSNALTSPNVSDSNGEPANLVEVLDDLVKPVRHGMKWCGQFTPMEAIEAHGKAVKEAADMIALAIRDLADSIRESVENT
jgi:hypothetical protein